MGEGISPPVQGKRAVVGPASTLERLTDLMGEAAQQPGSVEALANSTAVIQEEMPGTAEAELAALAELPAAEKPTNKPPK